MGKIKGIQELAKKNLLTKKLFKELKNLNYITHKPLYIDSIKLFKKKLQLNSPFETSFGKFDKMMKIFVVINFKNDKEEEISGIGECTPLPYPWYDGESDALAHVALEKYIIPALKTNSKKGITSVIDFINLYEGIVRNYMAKTAVEGAYWDAIGKFLGVPVSNLWGEQKQTVEAGTSVGGVSIEDTLNRVALAVEQGVARVKVKIKPGFDVNLIKAIRSKYPDLRLQVDANAAYRLDDSNHIKTLKKLDQFNLLMIEQPLWNNDRFYHLQLSKKLKTPICLDESIEEVRHAIEAIEMWGKAGILERLIINIKPPRVGGFWEAVKIARLCQMVGVLTWCGGMLESAVGKTANVHFSTLTDLPGDHVSQGKPYYKEDVAVYPSYHDGVINVPQEPGWGIKELKI